MFSRMITDIVDKSSIALFGISATCGVIIFCKEWLSELGVDFDDALEPYIAIGFFLCGFILIARATIAIYKKWELHRTRIKIIEQLTPEEVDIINQFIESQSANIGFHPTRVGSLVAKNIIYRSSDLAYINSFSFPYSVSFWVYDYIKYIRQF